jgi:hypothetical protein
MATLKKPIAVEVVEERYELLIWSDLTREDIESVEGVALTVDSGTPHLSLVTVDRRYDIHEVANELRVLADRLYNEAECTK